MPKLTQDKNGYYRIAVSPEIVRLFNLEPGKDYDWISSQGLPALKER